MGKQISYLTEQISAQRNKLSKYNQFAQPIKKCVCPHPNKCLVDSQPNELQCITEPSIRSITFQ